jgi:putative phosphoribosyl transferase
MVGERELVIGAAGTSGLPGTLATAGRARGVVIFAHGSGSSRMSPRNRQVAARLQDEGLATLLFDLLTPEESLDRGLVFDIPLLAERLLAATATIEEIEPDLALGYFGASTGAAAALWAAAEHPVAAVVSRGGRPDLAGERLPRVIAPTLLVVGGADLHVLELNEGAMGRMTAPTRLEIVPRAGHLFEEPGALEKVADLAAEWFGRFLGGAR